MPKCCEHCWRYDYCEKKEDCCDQCDYFKDGHCLYGIQEEELPGEPAPEQPEMPL